MAEAKSTRRHPNFKDLSGRKFGKWTVIREAPRGNGRIRWICRCECGTERAVRPITLQAEQVVAVHRARVIAHTECRAGRNTPSGN